jgi:hypothetical protein
MILHGTLVGMKRFLSNCVGWVAAGLVLSTASHAAYASTQAPSTKAITQELQVGLRKLELVCKPATPLLAAPSAKPWHAAQNTLTTHETTLATQARSITTRINQQVAQSCRAGTPNAGCSAAQAKQKAINTAINQERERIAQARQRLNLYARYELFEQQQCVQSGFTDKLWAVEMQHLWPKVMLGTERLQHLEKATP